ncbi:MAG TPA: Ig-like domain-containing protein [Candidatus Woesebacteria bacterium]|nr:Ig-like domain-containing protein [Candidatus Woesebacteria bacterium]HRT40288.1 Ig-like domain-containing protein [Candidatus Woesebacteria bacterium]
MAGAKKYTIIAFLIFSLAAIIYLISDITGFFSRATNPPSSLNLNNSYLFASPLQARADGQEKIRITVFILDGKGLGISNQSILIETSPLLTLENIQPLTDSYGKAVFDLTSLTPGQFPIKARFLDQTLPQTLKITFY